MRRIRLGFHNPDEVHFSNKGTIIKPLIFSSLLFVCIATAFAGDGTGTGLTSQYFDDTTAGGQHLLGTQLLTQVDPTVNFDFINAPPRLLTRRTNFSVKWTGQVQPRYSEQYLFMTYSDDGVRVTINGQLLINNWTNHAGIWNWNYINLQAGTLYNIEVDYYQGRGAANIQVWWQSTSQVKEIIPQSQLYSGKPSGGSTYFVSPSGSDSNSGLSPAQPWQSIARVNQQLFVPGDRILFQRSGRYSGSLQPQGSGSLGVPISMSAYGSGELPIIDGAGQDTAVKLFNQEYWEIDSLEVTGSNHYGVNISGDLASTVLHHFRLTNLSVHDLNGTPRWDSGLVMIAPIGDHLTFDDVVVDSVTAFNTNLWYGIHVGFNLWYGYPTQSPMSTNITIRNSTVHDVYGDGITVAQSHNVLVEHNVAYQTGLAPSGISYTPNAIWSWQCDSTVVQFNEGYSTHSFSYDGGVFDIDWGSTNTTIQYNYAHDADGYCVAIMGGHHVTTSNSIVRFNICSNNGRKSSMGPTEGDIFITTFDGGNLDGIKIYNNTGYWNPAGGGGWIRGRNVSLTGTLPRFITNNVLYSTSATLIDVDGTIPMDHDLYWAPTQGSLWKFGTVTAASFAQFRQLTNQEVNGVSADPQLNNPTYHAVGRSSSAFTLLSGSPAIGSGASGSGMGTSDFFGDALPSTGSPDIGAYYFSGTGERPASNPWVRIVSKNSGKCLDVTGISAAVGAYLQQWTCAGTPNQLFLITPVQGGYAITAQNSGLQLTVSDSPTATRDGARIIQSPYVGGSNQIWQVTSTPDGYDSITASNSGKCLDVAGLSGSNAASIQQLSCSGTDDEKWQLMPAQ